MKKIVLLVCLLLSLMAGAQDKKSLKDLLKKRDERGMQQAGNKEMTTSSTSENTGVSSANEDGLRPGNVHPNAKYLDVDYMYPFNGGAAVVKKGNATALIDTKANIIVPFNKYNFSTLYGSQKIGTGFFVANDELGYNIIINAQGKQLTQREQFGTLSDCGYYYVYQTNPNRNSSKPKNRYIYVDTALKKYESDYEISQMEDGIGIAGVINAATGETKQVYYSLYNNKPLFFKEYDLTTGGQQGWISFSEGLGLVAKTNEFGETKYGFINKKGEIVIPLIYSEVPTQFKYGLSKIIPANSNEIAFAYINKNGKIVMQQTIENVKTNRSGGYSYFTLGYTGWYAGGTLMDTLGKIYTHKDFCKNLGIPEISFFCSETNLGDAIGLYNDGKLRYGKTYKSTEPDGLNSYGYVDLKTKKSTGFMFMYAAYKHTLRFDPASKLAYAERYLGKDNKGNNIIRKGYINDDGIFVIVMAEKSGW